MTRRDWCAAAPSCVTLLGLGLSLFFLQGGAWWFGVLGLCCDLADGYLARRLDVASLFGARLDWSVDTLCAALAGAVLWWPLLALLPLVWALAESLQVKFSGRSVLFGAVMVVRFFE